MRLKDCQNDVLESLSGYLGALEVKRQEAEEFVQFKRAKGARFPLAIIAARHGTR